MAGALHEDAPHRFRRRREEMPAVLPLLSLLADEPQIGFVNQGRGLKGLVRRFMSHPPRSELAQFFVNEREQLIGRFGIAIVNGFEDLCDTAHARRVNDDFRMSNAKRR
jgi:hypothetical protein